MTSNWRDTDMVEVFSPSRDDTHFRCEVVKRDCTNDEPHGIRLVRCFGRVLPVAYQHSRQRYVWI